MWKWFYPLIVFISYLLFANEVRAQSDSSLQGYGIELNSLAGRIIKHTYKFTAPIPPLSTAFDLNLVRQTYGKKDWQQRRNYPVIGVGITYTDYGNNKVFGNCVGVYPNLQIPLLRRNSFELTLRIGDGLAYVTRKYRASSSPIDTLNNAIGSNVNDFAIFMLDFRYHINRHWQTQFGASFTHISDAAYHQPNLGVNMAGVHLGIEYFPISYNPKRIVKELPKLKNRWLTEIRAGIAYNEANAPGNPELPIYVVAASVSKRWIGKNKFFTGVDYVYHESTYAFLKYCGFYKGHEVANAWDGTVFAGNEFLLGPVGLVTQLSYYYRETYLNFDHNPLAEKIGIKYYLVNREKGFAKEVFLSALLNSHALVAEYAEFGTGVSF